MQDAVNGGIQRRVDLMLPGSTWYGAFQAMCKVLKGTSLREIQYPSSSGTALVVSCTMAFINGHVWCFIDRPRSRHCWSALARGETCRRRWRVAVSNDDYAYQV